MSQMQELRNACAALAAQARYVHIDKRAVPAYAASLPLTAPPSPDPGAHLASADGEERSCFWLTLDAINFGSGWFPTLRKREGRSGYETIALGIRERFGRQGPWSAEELQAISAEELASALGQDPQHPLIALYADALKDLGCHVADDFGGRFELVVEAAGRSAVALAEMLGSWSCFADTSRYGNRLLPFLKRAQIAAADLSRAGLHLTDLDQLTMFADKLVPHVLRLDGLLRFDPQLTGMIEREELIEHGSAAEVEIRACALHCVELIVAARPQTRAMDVDAVLWNRGQEPRYKAEPRHRTRCTAY